MNIYMILDIYIFNMILHILYDPCLQCIFISPPTLPCHKIMQELNWPGTISNMKWSHKVMQ